MKTTHMLKQERYVPPEMEILQFLFQSKVLAGSDTENPSGGDNPDNPWPTPNP